MKRKVQDDIKHATRAILHLRNQRLAEKRQAARRDAPAPREEGSAGEAAVRVEDPGDPNASTISRADYARFITSMKGRVRSARVFAAQAVNRELILIHWDIGRAILVKQAELGWGEAVIERISRDLLEAFPGMSGLTPENLRSMKAFYSAYAAPEAWRHAPLKLRPGGMTPSVVGEAEGDSTPAIVRQLVADIPWGHHLLIMDEVKNPNARLYYLQSAASFGWSRAVLLNQIKAGAYERSLAEETAHVFRTPLPEYIAKQAEETLKSAYNLEFLGIQQELDDRDLWDRLVGRLERFLLECDCGLCLVGRRRRLVVRGREHIVDVLLYHRPLRAMVAVNLRIGSCRSEFVRALESATVAFDGKERGEGDRPTIGVLLCAERDHLEARFVARTGQGSEAGAVRCDAQPDLPAHLKGKLPEVWQLKEVLCNVVTGAGGKP